MAEGPTNYYTPNSNDIVNSTTSFYTGFPPLNTAFAYEGVGSAKEFGWPGHSAENCDSWTGCDKPHSLVNFETLRSMPYGLGQPSSARYDISAGGWKTFGK